MKRNLVIAVIIIILFIVLALIAFGIYYVRSRINGGGDSAEGTSEGSA